MTQGQSGATIAGQCGSGSDGNERVLCIPQSSSTAGTSPSDCLVPYPGHSLWRGSYPPAEKQSVYSTASADWATDENIVHNLRYSPLCSSQLKNIFNVLLLEFHKDVDNLLRRFKGIIHRSKDFAIGGFTFSKWI